MATVSPKFDFVSAQIDSVPRITWENCATGDILVELPVSAQASLAGAVQFSGTFGGATVAMQCSNDGVTYYTITDITGQPVSSESADLFEFTSAAMYIRPSVAGGTGDDVNIVLVLRG